MYVMNAYLNYRMAQGEALDADSAKVCAQSAAKGWENTNNRTIFCVGGKGRLSHFFCKCCVRDNLVSILYIPWYHLSPTAPDILEKRTFLITREPQKKLTRSPQEDKNGNFGSQAKYSPNSGTFCFRKKEGRR